MLAEGDAAADHAIGGRRGIVAVQEQPAVGQMAALDGVFDEHQHAVGPVLAAKVERVDILFGACRFLFDEVVNFHTFRADDGRREDESERE